MKPNRYLFLDMNSFFASVEQQERPELRDRPIGVVPVETDSTCCIAASYEAKAFGVRTGTGVAEARKLCPSIRFALARPKIYVKYHNQIIESVEKCIHVEQVCSIDEMYGRLYRNEQDRESALGIAHKIKRAIRDSCGPYVRCSVGIAPNVWLAKVATDVKKPDGLTILQTDTLPDQLSHMKLQDLPGIGRGMSSRLCAYGVTTIPELYQLTERELSYIWGSKDIGSLWWHKLRGYDVMPRPTERRTVGHSHVLDPKLRNEKDAYAVLVRMTHKAAFRMRRIGYWTERLSCYVRFSYGKSWKAKVNLRATRDTITLVQALDQLWKKRPTGAPMKVAVTLSHLVPDKAVSLFLFQQEQQASALADTMDQINTKYRTDTIHLAAMLKHRHAAPTRIAFTQIPDEEDF